MYEDFLRTILRIEIAVRPPVPAKPQGDEEALSDELRGAQYSGPAEVDGDHSSPARRPTASAPHQRGGASNGNANAGAGKPRTYRKDEDPDPYVGVGRNDPCPCGSGKKFKNCHGRNR